MINQSEFYKRASQVEDELDCDISAGGDLYANNDFGWGVDFGRMYELNENSCPDLLDFQPQNRVRVLDAIKHLVEWCDVPEVAFRLGANTYQAIGHPCKFRQWADEEPGCDAGWRIIDHDELVKLLEDR